MNEQPKRDPRALNAYRHGLTGQIYIQTPEEQVAYEAHCKQYHRDYAPVGIDETQITQTIADDQWRLNRAKSIEQTIIALGISGSHLKDDMLAEAFDAVSRANAWLKNDKQVALMNLYAHRIQNAINKNRAILRQLQAERQAALQKAAEEMNLLAQLAEAEGEVFKPEADFPVDLLPPQFVFSTGQIASYATRLRRLTEAKTRPLTHRQAA